MEKNEESLPSRSDLESYYQEASIVQKSEQLGIGRPSTYSMLVETIQSRMYVEKQNIEEVGDPISESFQPSLRTI